MTANIPLLPMELLLSHRELRLLARFLLSAVLVSAAFFLFMNSAHAAVLYWVNPAGGNWSTAANWSTMEKGAYPGDGAVPGGADTAIFSYSGATVRVEQDLTVTNLSIHKVWTGSVVVGTGSLTVSSALTMGSGSLRGGSGNFSAVTFTQTGGVVRNLGANFSVSGNFSLTDGADAGAPSFTSTGTLIFNGAADQTFTVGAGPTLSLTDLTVNNTGDGTNDDIRVNVNGGLTLLDDLTITLGNLDLATDNTALTVTDDTTLANSAQATLTTDQDLTLGGDVIVGAAASFRQTAGTTTLNGAVADQTVTPSILTNFFNLTLNNTGDSTNDDIIITAQQLNVSGALLITLGNLNLETNNKALVVDGAVTIAHAAQATFISDAAVTVGGNITVGDAGSFTMSGTNTLTLNGGADQTVDVDGQSLYNLTINNTGAGANDDIVLTGSGLNISGSLVITAGNLDLATNNQVLAVEGAVTLQDAAEATFVTDQNMFVAGNFTVNNAATITVSGGILTLNGTADQTLDLDGQHLYSLTVNNTAGGTDDNIIVAADGQVNLSGSLIVTLGNLNLDTYNEPLVVEGAVTIAHAAQATLVSDAAVTVGGAITVGDAGSFTMSGTNTLTLNGAADQAVDLDGQWLYNLTVNNTGAGSNDDIVLAGSGLTLSGTLTITLGNLDLATGNQALVTEGNITLTSAAEATFVTDQNMTVPGNITVGALASFTASGGTLTLNGAADQTVTPSVLTQFYNLTINNSGGGSADNIIIAGQQLNLSGALVISNGNLDLTTNSKPMVVDGAVTLQDDADATLTSNSDMTVGGNFTVGNAAAITVTAGILTLNSATADQTLDLDGQSIYSLTINNTGGGTDDDITVAADSQLLLSGALIITNGNLALNTNTEAMVVEGSVTLANDADATLTTNSNMTLAGNITVGAAGILSQTAGTTTLNGGSDQTVTTSVLTQFYNLTINNSGGGSADNIIIAGQQLNLSGALVISNGNLDLTTNSKPMVVDGAVTLDNDADATLASNSNMTVAGNFTVSDAATITVTAGILTLNGAADQTLDLDGQRLYSLTINNAAGGTDDDINVADGSQVLLSGALIVTLGNLNLDTYNEPLVVEGAVTIAHAAQATLVSDAAVTVGGAITVGDAGSFTMSGTNTLTLNGAADQAVDLDGQWLYNLTVNNTGAGSNDDIVLAGSGLTLSGTLTITLGNLDLATGNQALVTEGNITIANAAQASITTDQNMTIPGNIDVGTDGVFTASGGTLTLNGAADQTLTGSVLTQFYNITINNSGGGTADDIHIDGQRLNLSGALVISNGNLDLSTNSKALVVDGAVTLQDDADATLTTDSNVTVAGNLAVGAAATWSMSAGTLTMNGGTQTMDFDSQTIPNLTIGSSTSTTLTDHVTVSTILQVNTGSTLALDTYTLTATSTTLINYATITEGTGQITHTASAFGLTTPNYGAYIGEIVAGSPAYFTLTDTDENVDGTTADTITFSLTLASGDSETVTLTETNKTSGVFRGSLSTANQTHAGSNGTLEATGPTTVAATFTDAQDAGSIAFQATFSATTGTTAATGGGGGGRGGGGGGGGGRSVVTPSTTTPATKPTTPARLEKKDQKKLTPKERAQQMKARALERRNVRLKKLLENVQARKLLRLNRWKTK